MEWSEVDEPLNSYPFCNISQSYKYLLETTIDIGTNSSDHLSEVTGCKPNCVSFKYVSDKRASLPDNKENLGK